MPRKSAFLAALLIISVSSIGCDVDEEHELELTVIDEDDAEQEPDAVTALDTPERKTEFNLSDTGKPSAAGSGGIGPSPVGAQRCCVNCGDKWSGWWDLGTGNTPKCNTRAPKWCHDHNWDFIDAEWFYKCPEG